MAILLDYAHRTESRIILSALVEDELLAYKTRYLKAHWDTYARSAGVVRGFVQSIPQIPNAPDFESVAKAQIGDLRKRLRIGDRDTLPVTESHLRDAMRRAMRRIPPCTERGEEIRDAVLWIQVVELVRKNQPDSVAFVSANVKQFASKDGNLLSALADEARPGRLVYYESLDAFGKQHATPIRFITREWLEERIANDKVFQRAESSLERLARRAAGSSLGHAPTAIEGYGIDLDDFYVYEMEDGTLRVQAYWYGTLQVPGDELYDYDLNPLTGKHDYHYSERDSESKDVEVIITIEAIVQGQHMLGWEVIDVDRG